MNDSALARFLNKLKLIKQAFHVKREEREQILWIKSNANPGQKGTEPESMVLIATKDRGLPNL